MRVCRANSHASARATQPAERPRALERRVFELRPQRSRISAAIFRPTAHGLTWLTSPDQPEPAGVDLYHGIAGPVLFHCELARATGEARYREIAERGAAELFALAPPQPKDVEAGLYSGTAGHGALFFALADLTGEERYAQAAEAAVAKIDAATRLELTGVMQGVNDVMVGVAGAMLFLVSAAARTSPDRALAVANRLGAHLLDLAQSGPRGGRLWMGWRGADYHMPNFSHGTAGIGFALARLASATGDPRFRQAAADAGEYLISIAKSDGEVCLIPHFVPEGEQHYYLGWCHGPAGTARLFHALDGLTGEAVWSTWRQRCVNAILFSGVPEMRTPGFWDNVGQCCGSAAVAEFCLNMYEHGGDPALLELARRLAEDIVARATPASEDGLQWVHAENRVEPYWKQSYTGYMQGAAGIGSLFIRLAAQERGADWKIRLPDDPFGPFAPGSG